MSCQRSGAAVSSSPSLCRGRRNTPRATGCSDPLARYRLLGPVPGKHSSDARRRHGAITKIGNGHACRVLVEAD